MPRNKNAGLDPTFDGDIDRDVLIFAIGDGGVGKSYFLNRLLGAIGQDRTRLEEGTTQDNCTREIQPIVIEEVGWMQHYLYLSTNPSPTRFVLVDTPALNADPDNHKAVLERVADWVKRSYGPALTETQTLIGGVIYLHDISQDRIPKTTYHNLLVLKRLLPHHLRNWSSVLLLTTKWNRDTEGNFSERELELRRDHWEMLLKSDSERVCARMARLEAGSLEAERSSALKEVQPLIEGFDRWMGSATLDIWTHVQEYCDGKSIRGQTFTSSLNAAIQDIINVLKRVSEAETVLEGSTPALPAHVERLKEEWKVSYEELERLQSQISAWDKFLLYLQGHFPRLWRQMGGPTPMPTAQN